MLTLVSQELDELEQHLLRGELWVPDTWPSGLSREPPRLDPDEPRRSLAELLALFGSLGASSPPPAGTSRLGWRLSGERGEVGAKAHPVLAAAIGAAWRDIATTFPELALIDHTLWTEVDGLDSPTRVHRWLRSPGRRLIQDLDLLVRFRSADENAGATDLSWEALARAAGAPCPLMGSTPAPPQPWRELHAAIPGSALRDWAPEGGLHLAAFYSLEAAEVALGRGGALAWLLDQTLSSPIITLDRTPRDLREELPARLASALAKESPAAGQRAALLRVEVLCLQHAALIADRRAPETSLASIWHVARWIQAIVLHSPFYGGDPETVAARLTAVLPADAEVPPHPRDALHPARFSITPEKGLALREFSLLAGLRRHLREERSLRDALPGPVLRWLEDLAIRPTTAMEMEAEKTWAARTADPLGWEEPHVAPNLLARHTLTQVMIPWLARAGGPVQVEVVEALCSLETGPIWPALALQREGGQLSEEAAAKASALWRDGRIPASPSWGRPAVGLGLLGSLEVAAGETLLVQIEQLDPEWRVKLLRLFCERLHGRTGERTWSDLVARGLLGLATLALDETAENGVRLEAAARCITLTRSRTLPGSDEALAMLAQAMDQPPLRGQPTLVATLRRLVTTVTGGGR